MKKGQIGILLSKFLCKMRLGVAPDCVLCNSAWHCPWSDWLAKRTFLETSKHPHWLIGWSMGVIHLCPQTSELSPKQGSPFPLTPRHSLWLREEFRTAGHFKGILSKWKGIDQLFLHQGLRNPYHLTVQGERLGTKGVSAALLRSSIIRIK